MKIVCFGDSITRGVSYIKGRLRIVKENYPSILNSLCSTKQNTVVLNKGVFNDNSDLLLKRLEKDVFKEQPDAVIICIGGNDCNFKWDEVAARPYEEHKPIVPLERYLNNIREMVKEINEKGIVPILLTLPPLDPKRYYHTISQRHGSEIAYWISKTGGIEHWHGLYNRRIKDLIKNINIPSIDVRTALKKAGDLKELISDDGIHLTSTGYSVMGKKIFEDFFSVIFEDKILKQQ
ncbi:SGNH/GDSL hydrolase family protein [Heyndrickxia ginsengihumi]|uniref:SGNH/GDSL hydrolase family protein n=1 Tax=Heyndrickxia ginsengihumi TaxID=363870 RepID=UPI003D1AD2DB